MKRTKDSKDETKCGNSQDLNPEVNFEMEVESAKFRYKNARMHYMSEREIYNSWQRLTIAVIVAIIGFFISDQDGLSIYELPTIVGFFVTICFIFYFLVIRRKLFKTFMKYSDDRMNIFESIILFSNIIRVSKDIEKWNEKHPKQLNEINNIKFESSLKYHKLSNKIFNKIIFFFGISVLYEFVKIIFKLIYNV